MELKGFAEAEQITSNDYQHDFRLSKQKMQDVLIEWCREFEENWQQTGKFPSEAILEDFKQQLIYDWEQKKVENKVIYELCSSDDAWRPEHDASVRYVLRNRKVKILSKTETGYEIEGMNSMKKKDVLKLNVSVDMMARFGKVGWFEIVYPINVRTKVDIIKKGALARLSTSSTKNKQVRYHKVERFELITKPTELDKTKAVWFMNKVKKTSQAPDLFFKVTFDPAQIKMTNI